MRMLARILSYALFGVAAIVAVVPLAIMAYLSYAIPTSLIDNKSLALLVTIVYAGAIGLCFFFGYRMFRGRAEGEQSESDSQLFESEHSPGSVYDLLPGQADRTGHGRGDPPEAQHPR